MNEKFAHFQIWHKNCDYLSVFDISEFQSAQYIRRLRFSIFYSVYMLFKSKFIFYFDCPLLWVPFAAHRNIAKKLSSQKLKIETKHSAHHKAESLRVIKSKQNFDFLIVVRRRFTCYRYLGFVPIYVQTWLKPNKLNNKK